MKRLRAWLSERRRRKALRWLNRDHAHNWSNWTEPEEARYLVRTAYHGGMPNSYFKLDAEEEWKEKYETTVIRSEQTRHCLECNLYERRFVE